MIFMNILMLISAVGFFIGGLFFIDEDDLKERIRLSAYFSGVPITCLTVVDMMSIVIILGG